MTIIEENICRIRKLVPDNIKIIAVSKTKPLDDILKAYQAKQKIFGENRVQELLTKIKRLPDDIEWHMIGHLQSKKVKQIIRDVSLIQSVDSPKLVSVINRESEKAGIVSDILLQFHIAREETKSGFEYVEATEMLDSDEFKTCQNLNICGVMGMATFTSDHEIVRKEFRNLKIIFERLKEKYFFNSPLFNEVSMGMSGDYLIAIEEGSTMIRVGSAIFGERNYLV